MHQALFLDRDGVVNRDDGYTHKWCPSIINPDIVPLIASYKKAGYLIIVITNQSGIGRGYYSELDFLQFMDSMQAYLAESDVQFDDYMWCACNPEVSTCTNRKPNPGLFFKAAERYDIDLCSSVMVGDKDTDMIAAERAGVGVRILFDVDSLASGFSSAPRFRIIQSLKDVCLLNLEE